MTPTLVSVAHSLKRQVRSRGAQRWRIDLVWDLLERAQFAPIWAFAVAQRGQFESFQIALPGHAPRGTWSGAPLVAGAHAAGGRAIAVDGFTPSQAGVAKAGDYIKFAGHAKVYLVTADASSDGLGATTLTIEPALMSALADNESIVFNNVPFTVALAEDVLEYPVRAPVLFSFSLSLVEDA